MQVGLKAAYDCIKQFSETDFNDDLKKVDIPLLVIQGDDDQIVPLDDSGRLTAEIVPGAELQIYPGARTACQPPTPTSSTTTSWPSPSADRTAHHLGPESELALSTPASLKCQIRGKKGRAGRSASRSEFKWIAYPESAR
jgi:hypothetical protein